MEIAFPGYVDGSKGPAGGLLSGETKLVGNGKSAANDANFTATSTDLNRADFRKKVPVLRQEWEKNTGQSWPKESYTASNGETKFRYYDAHHVIENKFGGKSEWWNITPALRGLEHQGGIHRAQGPADKIFGK